MKLLELAIKTLTIFLFFVSFATIVINPVMIAWYMFWGIITMFIATGIGKSDNKWSFLNGWVWNVLAIAYYLAK